MSFTLGSERGKSRAFQVQSNLLEFQSLIEEFSRDEEPEEPTFSQVAPIAKYGKEFIGDPACFSQFESLSSWGEPFLSPSSSIVDLLSDSISSVEILEIRFPMIEGNDLWSFVIQCDNLKELSLTFESDVLVELKPPERSFVNSRLEIFDFKSRGNYSIDWVSTSPWLGSNLTELRLSDERLGQGNLMKGPSDLILTFENITKTITKITLAWLHPRVESEGVAVKNLESLPNLKVLELSSLHPTFFDFFNTSVVYPNLQELSISYNDNSESPVECLLALLKANSSSLVKIIFNPYGNDAPDLPSENLNLGLNKLQDLCLGQCDVAGLWFAALSEEFPGLLNLSSLSSQSVRDAFSLKAPQLHPEDDSSEEEEESDDSSSDSSEDGGGDDQEDDE